MNRRYLLSGIGLIGLVLITSLAFFLSNNKVLQTRRTIEKTKASETLASKYCAVTDTTTLKNCFQKVRDNLVDYVEIKSLITCSGDQACGVNLSNITNRPVYIFGTTGSDVGFKRLDSFKYYIFNISSSSNIALTNLHFDENVSATCVYPTGGCVSPIAISGSTNLYLDRLKIEHSKVMGIEMSNSKEITIQNSTIYNSAVFGIWSSQNVSVRYLHNTFSDTKSNGILFDGNSPADKPSIIAGNFFSHNHRDAIFTVCNGPCSGGQLLVSNASNLNIENNTIVNGRIDAYSNLGASGIEFSLPLTNIQVVGNNIHNNSGWGIIVNGSSLTPSNVVINKNIVYSNSFGNIVFSKATIGTNCLTSYCPNIVTAVQGIIDAVTYPCFLGGNIECKSDISWNAPGTTNTVLKKDGIIVSTTTSGKLSQQTVSLDGSKYELYAGTSLLNTLYTIAVPASSSLSPTAIAQSTSTPTTSIVSPTVIATPQPTSSPVLCPQGFSCMSQTQCAYMRSSSNGIACGGGNYCCYTRSTTQVSPTATSLYKLPSATSVPQNTTDYDLCKREYGDSSRCETSINCIRAGGKLTETYCAVGSYCCAH